LVYLLISIAGLGALGILMRYSVTRGARALPLNFVFRGVVALVMGLFLWGQTGLSNAGTFVWPAPWLLSAASVAFWVSGISAIKAVQHGPLGVTWTILRCSMVLPVAASILLWDEFAYPGSAHLVAIRGLGIALGLGTVLFYGLMLQRQRGSGSVADRAWAPWMVLAFLSQGAWEVCLRATRDLADGPSRSLFLIVVFGASAILTVPLMWITGARLRRLELKLGAILGLSALVGSGFRIAALSTVDGTILFPLTTVAVILIAQGAGRLFWRERLEYGWIGLAIGSAAALLLTMGR
jgi:hypothetical protein